MLTTVRAAGLTVTGVSVGGVYTSLHVPELGAIFDTGIAPRSFVGAPHLFISHGHADHVGAFGTLLGIRGLSRAPAPRTFLPREIEADVRDAMAALSRTQQRPLDVDYVPLDPGDVVPLGGDLYVRAFRTLHSVPSLGYVLFRRVHKLRPEYAALAAEEIKVRRLSGEPLFETVERPELAYATDTLIDVLDEEPSLLLAKVLLLECTFLDERKTREEARQKYHVHLDEVIARADLFQNQALVLMHVSQVHSPAEARALLERRVPPELARRLVPFLPPKGHWPG